MKPNDEETIRNFDLQQATSTLTLANRWDHFLTRWGYKRSKHLVNPGLYKLGNPTPDSIVFVTANYTLSFDALRKELVGIDSYILVLDTHGINVWCAAGKGTFGTDELVHRIEVTGLNKIINHRKLILPQLGAPGVAAHVVKKRSGFNVEFGPVRTSDLAEYLRTHKATKEMRQVQFTLKDRLILIPVELVSFFIPLIIISIIFYFIGGYNLVTATASAILAAVILFPILLPWLPTHNFSTKGLILGILVSLPFFVINILGNGDSELWQKAGLAISSLLILPPITSFITLNFTGATTYTSRSGVKREIFKYIPIMAWMFGGGILLSLTVRIINLLGG